MKRRAAPAAIDAEWPELKGQVPPPVRQPPPKPPTLEDILRDYYTAMGHAPVNFPISIRVEVPNGAIDSDECATVEDALKDITERLIAQMRDDLRNSQHSKEHAQRALASTIEQERRASQEVLALESLFARMGVPTVEPPKPRKEAAKPIPETFPEDDDLPF